MASAQERQDVERLASGHSRIPTLEIPLIPDFLKQNPRYRAAWEQFDRALDYWRKTLQMGAGGAATVTGGAAGPTTIISGGGAATPPPFNEVDLKSLYLFEWVMS